MQAIKLGGEKKKCFLGFDAEHLVKGNTCVFYVA